ncbi:MYND-type domain-containing protein [Mycena venus]|uniref:MYND-type domain-containing protein n=1 Tax=Mycena venus TaxID=2733690 RepID=A0A8H6YHE3_9AGAR|nr:MYND-type domain-containing protein [Mycena venus]
MAYAALPFAIPGMHNALVDPKKWNSDWENITNRLQHVSPAQFVDSSAILHATEADGMDSSLLEYQGFLGSLISLQIWITRDAARYLLDDLEAKWTKASPALRGEHILVGLSNACSIAKNLHDTRIYCGRDFRLSRLRGDGGIVLGWLKAIMVPARDEEALEMLNKPRYVPDAAWDAFANMQQQSAPNDSEKLALGRILVLRTKLICHFLHCTLRSFMGEDLPKIAVEKYNKKKNPQSFLSRGNLSAVAEQVLGPAGAKAAAKENKAAWKDRQRDRREYCSYVGCCKPNDGTEKFPRCKKCWDGMQREVLYCSAQCQKADWKSNHKAICGKALSFDAVSKPKLTYARTSEEMPSIPTPAESALVIGAPTGSYKRTPLLIAQIDRLNRFPKLDYVITDSSTPWNMDFPDPEAQSLFRKCREKAMATGDRQSIAIMAHFLCWMAIGHKPTLESGVTPNVIVGQLKKEYLFDELHLAVAEMQQLQNRDPFRRPMSPQNWLKFCKGMNVHQQVILS